MNKNEKFFLLILIWLIIIFNLIWFFLYFYHGFNYNLLYNNTFLFFLYFYLFFIFLLVWLNISYKFRKYKWFLSQYIWKPDIFLWIVFLFFVLQLYFDNFIFDVTLKSFGLFIYYLIFSLVMAFWTKMTYSFIKDIFLFNKK